MVPPKPMPRRDQVDPAFDGHLERPVSDLTVDEKLDWIWQCMQLLRAGQRARAGDAHAEVRAECTPGPHSPEGSQTRPLADKSS